MLITVYCTCITTHLTPFLNRRTRSSSFTISVSDLFVQSGPVLLVLSSSSWLSLPLVGNPWSLAIFTFINFFLSVARDHIFLTLPVMLCSQTVCNMEQQGLVELSGVQIQELERKALCDRAAFLALLHEEDVETSHGSVHVSLQGKKDKPAIVTYHDIGQNHTSAFLGFFNYHDIQPLLEHFCIYHIDAPGQEEGCPQFSSPYPTMDELAEMLSEVLDHFSVKRCIGLGIGAGANVLCRYALRCEDKVEGLVLVNCGTSSMGWIEWGYQKVIIRSRTELHNIFYLCTADHCHTVYHTYN